MVFDEHFHWLRTMKEILSTQLMGGGLNCWITSSMGGYSEASSVEEVLFL